MGLFRVDLPTWITTTDKGSLLVLDHTEPDGTAWVAPVAAGQVLTSAGAGAAPAWSANPSVSGLLATGSGGVGYAAGAGGAVTQLTNKSTGVTLDTITGQITMNNAALAAGAEVSFVVTDAAVAATDVIIINHASAGTAGAYQVTISAVGAGSFTVTVSNASAGALGEAIVLNFAVIKGAAS